MSGPPAVYSVTFCRVNLATGSGFTFGPEDGFTYIIKQVFVVVNPGVDDDPVTINAEWGGGGGGVLLFSETISAGGISFLFALSQLHVVFGHPWTLELTATAADDGNADFTLSGYQLQGNSPLP